MKHEKIREVTFRPYESEKLPSFKLELWDTYETDNMGKNRLGYTLTEIYPTFSVEIFNGEDFYCSPLHAIDSDDTVKSIMGFLTLRPGDTDSEYFDEYTYDQKLFTEEHAETLSLEVEYYFG